MNTRDEDMTWMTPKRRRAIEAVNTLSDTMRRLDAIATGPVPGDVRRQRAVADRLSARE
jgi:hypothetical protein